MNHRCSAKPLTLRARAASTALVMMFGSMAASPLHAEAIVTGHANATRLEARNASISEVLTALGMTYQMRSRSTAELNKSITGTYAGSALEIVSHVLVGYDYLVKPAHGQLSIIIYGLSKNPPNISTAGVVSGQQNRQQVAQRAPTRTESPRTVHAPESAAVSGSAGDSPLTASAAAPAASQAPATFALPAGGVSSLLEAAAASQIPGGLGASAPPSGAVNMAALTQTATASLQSLVFALNKVPHL